MTRTEIRNTDNVIDIRDVIQRVDELETEHSGLPEDRGSIQWDEDGPSELRKLLTLLDECRGEGGDEQWRGDWYPITLIREDHFQDYAQELAEDIGAINVNASWPNNCIDWKAAAEQLKMDYTSVNFDGITYYTR
jgi:hypothetical protein